MDLGPHRQGWQLPLLLVGPRLKSVALEQSSTDRSMKVKLILLIDFPFTSRGLVCEAGGWCATMGF